MRYVGVFIRQNRKCLYTERNVCVIKNWFNNKFNNKFLKKYVYIKNELQPFLLNNIIKTFKCQGLFINQPVSWKGLNIVGVGRMFSIEGTMGKRL